MIGTREYTGRDVLVRASGMVYEGRVIEMTERALLLRTATGHCEVPMTSINSIEFAGVGKPTPMAPSPLASAGK